jgi:DNA (cytosine-5)-methyltransferase 1
MTYTAGSLFSGIGGFDWPFSLVGFDVRWQAETDLYCQQVLKKHAPQYWPNARMYGDVRELGKHNLEPVDAVVGGPPCQAASTAGKRLGKQDDRWLWGEALRIVKEIQPQIVLFENVPGLRSLDGGNSLKQILGGLAEAGLDAEWFHLRASDVGAPHERERIFIVAYAASTKDGSAG